MVNRKWTSGESVKSDKSWFRQLLHRIVTVEECDARMLKIGQMLETKNKN